MQELMIVDNIFGMQGTAPAGVGLENFRLKIGPTIADLSVTPSQYAGT
jgi:hypothetical protein